MLTNAYIKAMCDDRMQQLNAEVQRCLEIANLLSNPIEEKACYDRIVEIEREMGNISDHLYYMRNLAEMKAQTTK